MGSSPKGFSKKGDFGGIRKEKIEKNSNLGSGTLLADTPLYTPDPYKGKKEGGERRGGSFFLRKRNNSTLKKQGKEKWTTTTTTTLGVMVVEIATIVHGAHTAMIARIAMIVLGVEE